MSRTRFQTIRGSLQIHPPIAKADGAESSDTCSDTDSSDESVVEAVEALTSTDTSADGHDNVSAREAVPMAVTGPEAEARARRDPLRHSRHLLEHIQRKFSTTAVPFGVSSLDENGVRTKARTLAKSFMPLKPDKFAVRFYAVVGWRSLYVHSIWDNGSGNTLPTTPSQRYTQLFPMLRTPVDNTLQRPDVKIKSDSAAALWLAMIAHQTKMYPDPTGRRLLVCDNFYTRHIFAKALLALTDGEVRILGTARQDWVDGLNKAAVVDAIARVTEGERGAWELIAAVDSIDDSKKAREAHKRAQAKLPSHLRTTYAPHITFSSCAGFVVFKDKRPVVFYTNDLAKTPSARVLDGNTDEAIACCHGLYPMRRWAGVEVMHRTTFQVPAIVAAYNLAMNGVDRVDQLRATNPTRRKEVRLSMSIFTWALDLSIINAFALMRHMDQGDNNAPKTLREFKRRVCVALVATYRADRERKKSSAKRPYAEPAIATSSTIHALTPNSCETSSGKLVCYLCSLRGIKSKSRFGCTQCLRGFHVACFCVVHYKDELSNGSASVATALETLRSAEAGHAPFQTRRLNKSITQLNELELPQQDT